MLLTWLCIFYTLCLLKSDEDLAKDHLTPLVEFRHTPGALLGFVWFLTDLELV